jgi:hypothetical protein
VYGESALLHVDSGELDSVLYTAIAQEADEEIQLTRGLTAGWKRDVETGADVL